MVIPRASTPAVPQGDNGEAAEMAARLASGPGFWTEWLAELGREGLLEALLADDVIARALREAPAGHRYDRVLTAKMTVICVLVACLFSSAGYDSVLATAFAARPEARSASGSRPIRRHNQARPDALPQPAIGDQEQSDSTIVVAAEQAMRPSGVLDAIYCRKKLIKSLVSGFGFGPVYRCSTAT